MTGEDDLLAENARLKQTNQNMAIFISKTIEGLEKLGRALSIESGTIFSMIEQMKAFQKQSEQK